MFLLPSAAQSQVEPASPIHVTVNGIFFLCPRLIQQESPPPAADLSKLGYEATAALISGQLWFKGDGGKGTLTVSYDPVTKSCTLDYLGVGYEQISGVTRDMVERNGFTRIIDGNLDGAKGDVFEGATRGRGKTARIIILENFTDHSASVNYAER